MVNDTEMTAEGLVAAHPNAIWTCSDNMVEPLDMLPDMVDINDIAYALSNAPRFTGHVKRTDGFPLTVAQHSVNVATLVIMKQHRSGIEPNMQLALKGLTHDASEAYLSDMARPLKHYNNFGDLYREIEDGLARAIDEALGLPYGGAMPEIVRWADNVALSVECRDFMGRVMADMYTTEEAHSYFPQKLSAASHVDAEAAFLRMYTWITKKIRQQEEGHGK